MIGTTVSHYRVLRKLGGGGTLWRSRVDGTERLQLTLLPELVAGWPVSLPRHGLRDTPGEDQRSPRGSVVASIKGFSRPFGDLPHWFGLAPDDSPLVLRDVGTHEIYALDWEAP